MTISIGSRIAELKQRIESRQARIGIVGMGYVGLPLALLFSDERFRVTGFDIAADKVRPSTRAAPISSASCPPRSTRPRNPDFAPRPTILQIAEMDAVIICVPTPLE